MAKSRGFFDTAPKKVSVSGGGPSLALSPFTDWNFFTPTPRPFFPAPTVPEAPAYVVRWRLPINVGLTNQVGLLMPANRDRVAARLVALPSLFSDPSFVVLVTDQSITNPTLVSSFHGALVSEVANREYVWPFPTAPQNAIYFQFNPNGGSNSAVLFVEETLRVRADSFTGANEGVTNSGPRPPVSQPQIL